MTGFSQIHHWIQAFGTVPFLIVAGIALALFLFLMIKMWK